MLMANPIGPGRSAHLFSSATVKSRKRAMNMTATAMAPIHAGLNNTYCFFRILNQASLCRLQTLSRFHAKRSIVARFKCFFQFICIQPIVLSLNGSPVNASIYSTRSQNA